MRGIVANCS